MVVLLVSAGNKQDKSKRASQVCYNGVRHKSDPGNIVKTFFEASIALKKPFSRTDIYVVYIL